MFLAACLPHGDHRLDSCELHCISRIPDCSPIPFHSGSIYTYVDIPQAAFNTGSDTNHGTRKMNKFAIKGAEGNGFAILKTHTCSCTSFTSASISVKLC